MPADASSAAVPALTLPEAIKPARAAKRAVLNMGSALKTHTHAGEQRDVVELALDGACIAGSLGELQGRIEQVLCVEVDLHLSGDGIAAAHIEGEPMA